MDWGLEIRISTKVHDSLGRKACTSAPEEAPPTPFFSWIYIYIAAGLHRCSPNMGLHWRQKTNNWFGGTNNLFNLTILMYFTYNSSGNTVLWMPLTKHRWNTQGLFKRNKLFFSYCANGSFEFYCSCDWYSPLFCREKPSWIISMVHLAEPCFPQQSIKWPHEWPQTGQVSNSPLLPCSNWEEYCLWTQRLPLTITANNMIDVHCGDMSDPPVNSF